MKTGESSFMDVLVSQFKANAKQYAMIIALVGISLIFHFSSGFKFLEARNLSNLFLQTSYIMALAIGMVLVIVAGHIDLSVGSLCGLMGGVAAILQAKMGWPTIPTVLVTLAVGVVVGFWQGFWIAYRRLPAFIVTLAGFFMWRGVLLVITESQTIVFTEDLFRQISKGYLPKLNPALAFHDLSSIVAVAVIILFVLLSLRSRAKRQQYGLKVPSIQMQILGLVLGAIAIGLLFYPAIGYKGVPYSMIIIALFVLLFNFVTRNTVFGRHVYAIGGNKEAARLSGINIKKTNLFIFVIMGFLSALSGIIYASRLNSATASAGTLLELEVIASAIIGGTSTLGGEGTIIGAIVGALIMGTLNNGMDLLGADSPIQMIVKGGVLILAVWFDIATRKKEV
jgi:D-xylose transport system permease protein